MEEIQMFLDEGKEMMDKSLRHSESEINKIRAGRAQPSMLDSIFIDYYGSQTPLSQVSSITTPDPRTILIRPFEKKIIAAIELGIKNANLGINPQNDGEQIRLNIPALTQERRRDLVKQSKNETENAKIKIRNIRKEINELLRKLLKEGAPEDDVKRAEEKVQDYTNTSIAKLDQIAAEKEKEIMTV